VCFLCRPLRYFSLPILFCFTLSSYPLTFLRLLPSGLRWCISAVAASIGPAVGGRPAAPHRHARRTAATREAVRAGTRRHGFIHRRAAPVPRQSSGWHRGRRPSVASAVRRSAAESRRPRSGAVSHLRLRLRLLPSPRARSLLSFFLLCISGSPHAFRSPFFPSLLFSLLFLSPSSFFLFSLGSSLSFSRSLLFPPLLYLTRTWSLTTGSRRARPGLTTNRPTGNGS